MTRHIISAALLLIATSACRGVTEPTGTTSPPPVTTVFTGSLAVGGSSVHQLSVTQASTAAILMASLTAGPVGAPIQATVGLALGTPPEESEGCPRTIDRRVSPALVAQLRTDRTAGTHCLEIYDPGTLTRDVAYAVRVVVTPVANTDPAPTPAPGTVTFASILPMGGSATRLVRATAPGTLSAIVTAATPPNALVGLGLGIPRADNAGCLLTTAVNSLTSAAVPVASAVDAGEYCVRIYDTGTLPANVNFTVTAVHP